MSLHQYAFSLDEVRQPEVLATSGCFSFIHLGHKAFIEDFSVLQRILKLPAFIFLNTAEYIKERKKIKPELLLLTDEERISYFEKYKLRVLVSDNGLEEYDLKNVLWFTGSEYINKNFKESRHVNERVVGNVFRLELHQGSSRDLISTRELWNIRSFS
jgi:FAD synthase